MAANSFYTRLLRPLLFLKDPEEVHHQVFRQLKKVLRSKIARDLAQRRYLVQHPSLELELFGIKFPNPVGLAAGFDKDAIAIDEMAALGFGFIEIGTVTPKPQTGNEKPRLFRLPKDRAIINRMGFNNRGTEEVAERLSRRKSKVIVGGNIGKNKATPNGKAQDDYLSAYLALRDHVDYFTVNVSSPNTPGLRGLQEKGPLTELLTALMVLDSQQPTQKPILLKIAPDLTDSQLDDIIAIVDEVGIAGVIATNTTISRDGLATDGERVKAIGNGGLSGAPLAQRATEVIRYLHRKSGGSFPIIGVGGIMCASDALEKIAAGASLVQIYTGFVYEGPDLVRNINKAILAVRMDASSS